MSQTFHGVSIGRWEFLKLNLLSDAWSIWLLSDGCHWTLLVISEYRSNQDLDTSKKQAVTCASIDLDLCRNMVPLVYNEIKICDNIRSVWSENHSNVRSPWRLYLSGKMIDSYLIHTSSIPIACYKNIQL